MSEEHAWLTPKEARTLIGFRRPKELAQRRNQGRFIARFDGYQWLYRADSVQRYMQARDKNDRTPRLRSWAPGVTDVIYVIRAVGTGRVKVGFTGKLDSRIRGIAVTSPFPLELVGVESAQRSVESEVHSALHEWRVHGEWFETSGDHAIAVVRQVITAWREGAEFISGTPPHPT